MDFKLRLGKPEDAETCARICYEAFASIARKHNFPPDILVEAAVGLISMLLGHPGFYSVVAESNGRIVGSNFLDERAPISGVGPITVDPAVQDSGVGRLLMQDVMRRATQRSAPGIRLVQSAYHNRSLSLYAKLGFQVREQLACMQGAVPQGDIPGYRTRRAMPPDAETCNALCRRIHGHDRAGELTDALGGGSALVVEHDGRISGYATGLAFRARGGREQRGHQSTDHGRRCIGRPRHPGPHDQRRPVPLVLGAESTGGAVDDPDDCRPVYLTPGRLPPKHPLLTYHVYSSPPLLLRRSSRRFQHGPGISEPGEAPWHCDAPGRRARLQRLARRRADQGQGT